MATQAVIDVSKFKERDIATVLDALGVTLFSVATGLTATGNNRATALVLTATSNFLSTVAASTGVLLPPTATMGVGTSVYIYNAGANILTVYGSGSDTIDGVAGATGVALTNAKRCEYFVSAAGAWVSAQLGVISA